MNPKKSWIFSLIFLIFGGVFFFQKNAFAQTTYCGTGEGGLCDGISNDAYCTNVYWPNCETSFPRCFYSGTINGYFCENNCVDTGQSGSCGLGSTCLCVNRTPCSLCTSSGKNLSACSDSGCGSSDTTPPTISISSPTANSTYTSAISPIVLSGTASDNSVLTEISWSNNRNADFVGGSGMAEGTGNWSIAYANLETGQNIITVTAKDGMGNTASDTLTVTYSPPATPHYPAISLSEGSSDYSINITDSNTLTEISYAWSKKPNVYFLIPFMSDSNPNLSLTEKARYETLARNLPASWDALTQNKHPLKFYFPRPFQLTDYASSDNSWFSYVKKSIARFEADNAAILARPSIYVFLYPDPYFQGSYVNIFGTEEKEVLAEAYLAMLHDGNRISGYSNSDEILKNVVNHEIAHVLTPIPNNVNVPPGTQKYFWLGHPAGFEATGGPCGEDTAFYDCQPFAASESPTGTDGYYEVYSILSPRRILLSKENIQNRDPELSPLDQMEMGLRSRYEDAPYMYYEGNVTYPESGARFNLIAEHNYNLSSRKMFDYTNSVPAYYNIYWHLTHEVEKTTLPVSQKSFSVPKSGQSGRSLIVFASEASYPGHFKVFGNGGASESYDFISVSPGSPLGLSVK